VPDVACWHAGRNLDHLVVESSGVADPLPIVLTFLRPEFRNRVRVDAIVSVADAESFSLDLFAPARTQSIGLCRRYFAQ
jgi:G3E family GTPase